MTFKAMISCVVTSACALLITASCSEEVVYRRPVPGRRHGPPPHARAVGHRRKHVEGVELIFDAGMGVYVVVGWTDYYYYDGTFYRLHDGLWEVSLHPDRAWAPVGHKPLPPGLAAKKGKGSPRDLGKANTNGKQRGIGKGNGNGKHKKTS